MRTRAKIRFAVKCALAEARKIMQTPIDKAAAAVTQLEQAVAGAKARRQATNDRDAQNAAKVAEHQKTITELTAKSASAENALTALTDKVGALTSSAAGIS